MHFWCFRFSNHICLCLVLDLNAPFKVCSSKKVVFSKQRKKWMWKQHCDAQIFQHGGAYQIYQILCLHYPKINKKVVTVNLSSFLCHCTTEKRWRKMKGADVLTRLRSEISLLILYCSVSVLHCGTHALGPNLSFMSLHYQTPFSALGPFMNWSLLGGDSLRHQGVYTISGVQTLFSWPPSFDTSGNLPAAASLQAFE